MNIDGIRWRLWVPLVIVTATVLAYVDAFGNPFLFDDGLIIVQNPDMRTVWPVVLVGRWLVNLSFKLNYAVGELRVADYHAVNLLIHIGAALLLFGWLRRTLLLPRSGAVWARHAPFLAGSVAVLWSVHPLQTESVTYICQRYESLMGLSFLATMYTFVRGVEADGARRGRVWFGLSVLCCLLGTGTKEVMLMAPLVVLLYDLWVVGPSPSAVMRRRWGVHMGLWLTLVCSALLARQMFDAVAVEGQGVTLAVSPLQYLLTQMEVIPHYLKLSLLPVHLCFDYGWPLVTSWQTVIGPGTLLVALGAWTLLLCLRGRPHAFIGLWFFAILAPTSSVISVPDAAFEHRMYLPLAAVIGAFVLGSYWLFRGAMRSQRSTRAAVVVVLVLVAVEGGLTHQRNRVYQSPLSMWENVVAVRPTNHRACLNLASALLTEGRLADAESVSRTVVARLSYCKELEAGDIPAWGTNAEGTLLYRDARHYALAYNYIGVARIQQGDAVGAERCFAEAVRLRPELDMAQRNLAEVRRTKEKPRRSGASPSI
ncbi:MAG: tetratricopeptide repeat protein [Lentisphaerae bacterium]|nr:tetratricopeptide repeat protein [Lentisphaerota bacterium]